MVPASISATEGVNKAIAGISISDPDATGNVTTTLSVLHGTLTVLAGVTGGLTSGDISNNGTGTVTLTGTVAEINATLATTNGLIYLEQGDHTGDTLTVATQDQGTSPLLTATSTVPITVTGLPVIAATTTQTIGINQATTIAVGAVTEANAASGETFTVELKDTTGLLSASGATSATTRTT